MDGPARTLAQAVKTRRADLGWSLDRTAAATGVSKAMLGQIERGESSPTVSTLWKIATGLKVSMSSLMAAAPGAARPLPQRRDAADLRRDLDGGGMGVALLFPFDPNLGHEVFELTLRPGYETRSDPHEAGVVETVMVVSGRVEILTGGAWRDLGPGQSLRFAGDAAHGYRNRGPEPAVLLDVISYP